MVTNISVKDALEVDNAIILDARSPKEYNEDHILTAINIPLLDDQERHEVGLMYKQFSREKAIERGMEILPKKIPEIYRAVKGKEDKNIIVYCARGGMRSGIIASIISSIGFKVFKITGGYKAFRNHLLKLWDTIDIKPKFILFYGRTCVGKTLFLQHFPNHINLEGIAKHRGSLYGEIGQKQSSQKRFENILYHTLQSLQHEPFIFLEGESRRIGDCIIPANFWKSMKGGAEILCTKSFEKRVDLAVSEYCPQEYIPEMIETSKKLKRVISKKRKAEMIEHFENEEVRKACAILLQDYYDPLYDHTLKKLEVDFVLDLDDFEGAKRRFNRYVEKIYRKGMLQRHDPGNSE